MEDHITEQKKILNQILDKYFKIENLSEIDKLTLETMLFEAFIEGRELQQRKQKNICII